MMGSNTVGVKCGAGQGCGATAAPHFKGKANPNPNPNPFYKALKSPHSPAF